MIGPAKNRLHGYEAGWLTLLVSMRVASEDQVREAWGRVVQTGIDAETARLEKRHRERKRRRRRRDGR